MRTTLTTVAAILLLMQAAHAAVQSRTVDYDHNGSALEGYLAWDDRYEGARPGVLVVHEWYGLNDYARRRADQLAELGYIAFAADIYGKGVRPTNNEEAGAEAGKYRADRPLLRGRAMAGLDALLHAPNVDRERIAAIGYCFGGMTVLELARSGADIDGVVSFHGSYTTDMPAQPGQVKAKVLVLHGAADPATPWDQVLALKDEMEAAQVDWQLVAYAGALHAFTNPEVNRPPNAAYHPDADRRSWEDMLQFFAELFGDHETPRM
jgi:dienelactone hydrolase